MIVLIVIRATRPIDAGALVGVQRCAQLVSISDNRRFKSSALILGTTRSSRPLARCHGLGGGSVGVSCWRTFLHPGGL